MLYDYTYQNQERIEKIFEEHDIAHSKIGFVSVEDFKRIIEDEKLLAFLTLDDMNELSEKHEREPVGFDYKTFLTGKKYLTKPYLMSAFEAKKTKVTKPKKAKKQKGALPSKLIVCEELGDIYIYLYSVVLIQDEGPRTENGNPPKLYAVQHVHHTDNTRFSRDKLPKNPLEDDSPWYLDKPDKLYVNLCDAGNDKASISHYYLFSISLSW
jgi:hypothetical protein